MFSPIGRVESINPDAAAGRRGVDEFAVSKIDSDMRRLLAFLIKKHQIAPAQFVGIDLAAHAAQRTRIARKLQPDA